MHGRTHARTHARVSANALPDVLRCSPPATVRLPLPVGAHAVAACPRASRVATARGRRPRRARHAARDTRHAARRVASRRARRVPRTLYRARARVPSLAHVNAACRRARRRRRARPRHTQVTCVRARLPCAHGGRRRASPRVCAQCTERGSRRRSRAHRRQIETGTGATGQIAVARARACTRPRYLLAARLWRAHSRAARASEWIIDESTGWGYTRKDRAGAWANGRVDDRTGE